MIEELKENIQKIDRLQTEQNYSEAEVLCEETIKLLPSSKRRIGSSGGFVCRFDGAADDLIT